MSTHSHTLHALTRLAKGGNAEIYAWGETHVVKLFRPGLSRLVVDAELQQARMAHAGGIPTPQPEDIVEVEGRYGIVLERCDGPTLFELVFRRAHPVKRLAQIFFELQRAIHGCDGTALQPIGDRLSSKIRHAAGVSDTVKRTILEQITRLPQGNALCHGDFHPDNVIMATRGPMIIDWLNAGRGDAVVDIVRSRLLLEYARPGQVDPQIRAEFLVAYAECCRDSGYADTPSTTQWLLPVAVARLAEPISDTERSNLIALIERVVAAAPLQPAAA